MKIKSVFTRSLMNKFRLFSGKADTDPARSGLYAAALSLLSRIITPRVRSNAEVLCFLVPGAFLILAGLSALFYPDMILPLAAGFCFSFGLLFCVLSMKVLALKRKLARFSHQIEAHLIVTPGPGKIKSFSESEAVDSKKIVLH